jgi:hypothetical protein
MEEVTGSNQITQDYFRKAALDWLNIGQERVWFYGCDIKKREPVRKSTAKRGGRGTILAIDLFGSLKASTIVLLR